MKGTDEIRDAAAMLRAATHLPLTFTASSRATSCRAAMST